MGKNDSCISLGLRLASDIGGAEDETSSDASDEAPERAQKDTPKEVSCFWGSALLCVFLARFSGFHPTPPMSAMSPLRGKSVCSIP